MVVREIERSEPVGRGHVHPSVGQPRRRHRYALLLRGPRARRDHLPIDPRRRRLTHLHRLIRSRRQPRRGIDHRRRHRIDHSVRVRLRDEPRELEARLRNATTTRTTTRRVEHRIRRDPRRLRQPPTVVVVDLRLPAGDRVRSVRGRSPSIWASTAAGVATAATPSAREGQGTGRVIRRLRVDFAGSDEPSAVYQRRGLAEADLDDVTGTRWPPRPAEPAHPCRPSPSGPASSQSITTAVSVTGRPHGRNVTPCWTLRSPRSDDPDLPPGSGISGVSGATGASGSSGHVEDARVVAWSASRCASITGRCSGRIGRLLFTLLGRVARVSNGPALRDERRNRRKRDHRCGRGRWISDRGRRVEFSGLWR